MRSTRCHTDAYDARAQWLCTPHHATLRMTPFNYPLLHWRHRRSPYTGGAYELHRHEAHGLVVRISPRSLSDSRSFKVPIQKAPILLLAEGRCSARSLLQTKATKNTLFAYRIFIRIFCFQRSHQTAARLRAVVPQL